MTVWERQEKDQKFPDGEHWFNFSFQLPYALPPTFSSYYGCVKYELEARVDVPWWFDKTTCFREFFWKGFWKNLQLLSKFYPEALIKNQIRVLSTCPLPKKGVLLLIARHENVPLYQTFTLTNSVLLNISILLAFQIASFYDLNLAYNGGNKQVVQVAKKYGFFHKENVNIRVSFLGVKKTK